MGAAHYVGRVGGLAAALGIGIGIFLAAGTASADTEESSRSTSTSSSESSSESSKQSPSQASSKSAEDGADSHRRNSIKIRSTARDDDGKSNTKRRSSSTRTADDPDVLSAKSTSRHRPAEVSETDRTATATASTSASELSALQSLSSPTITPTPQLDGKTLPTAAVTYAPVIGLDDGVITGVNPPPTVAARNPLTYTLVRDPSAGGKVTLDKATGDFTFLPYLSPAQTPTSEQFSVLVAQTTVFTRALEQIPVVKYVVPTVLLALHQVPILKDVLAPIIGRSAVVPVLIDVASYVGPGPAPIAFTTTVDSFDGTPISVNYFPKSGLGYGQRAETILNGPSLATAGYTDLSQPTTVVGLVPGISAIRAGYNVVTWDPRGEFASGGILHLDSEDFEARDVSAIIDWVAQQPGTRLEDPDDPYLGMVGGSYGGGIQLTSAGIDTRIDAIAPGIAWNSLDRALYPNSAFKTAWASLLLLSLVVSGSRIDPEIYAGIATGVLLGFLTPGQREFLSANSPDTVVRNIMVPTLFLQGTVDGLFTLQQALDNADALDDTVPVRMIWYCGGHGACLDLDAQQTAAQSQYLTAQTLAWMDAHVKGLSPATLTGPKFVWVDQRGAWHSSNLLPVDGPMFYGPSITASGNGGVLPIVPILGGSGPQSQAPFPLSLTTAAKAEDAVELAVKKTSGPTVHVVGAPTVTMTYSGIGTSRNVYAQLVDNKTGRVVGNLVTPIPVTLDGRARTVAIPMENIAYTMARGGSLTLQIVDSATAYENFTAFGAIHISTVGLTLPTAANVQDFALPPAATIPAGPAEAKSLEDLMMGTRAGPGRWEHPPSTTGM